jgi:hypothetical protein
MVESVESGGAMNRRDDLLVLLGAAVGGLRGYGLFFWLAGRGLP